MQFKALLMAVLFGCSHASGAGLKQNVNLVNAATVSKVNPKFPTQAIPLGEINEANLQAAYGAFDDLVSKGEKNVLFRITSPGGQIFNGLAFIQKIEEVKKAKNVHVQCVVDIEGASMAFIILQDSMCDERYMTKRSFLLAHEAATDGSGNAQAMQAVLNQLTVIDNLIAEIAAKRLKMSVDEYKAKIAKGDWMMNYQEALQVGAVDGVVTPESIPTIYSADSDDSTNIIKQLLKKLRKN